MKRPSKPVYRTHDVIEIVEPLIVKRVGYPLGLADGIAHIEATYSKEIRELLIATGVRKPSLAHKDWLIDEEISTKNDVFAKIARALAYEWVAQQGFGGDLRSIHTELREDLRGRRCQVYSKRNVKTGTRYAATSSTDYWGEHDYEPGGLDNCRTHVILECHLLGDGTTMGFADPFEIEACHVKAHVPEWMAAETA